MGGNTVFNHTKTKKKIKLSSLGGHIWHSHVILGGTLATMGPPSFWDISNLVRAAGLVKIKKPLDLVTCVVYLALSKITL